MKSEGMAQVLENLSMVSFFRYNRAITGKLSSERKLFVTRQCQTSDARWLQEMAILLLNELKDLPSKVTEPDWLEEVEEKDGKDGKN